jgi:hypothetical protein
MLKVEISQINYNLQAFIQKIVVISARGYIL